MRYNIYPGFDLWGNLIFSEFQNKFNARTAQPRKKPNRHICIAQVGEVESGGRKVSKVRGLGIYILLAPLIFIHSDGQNNPHYPMLLLQKHPKVFQDTRNQVEAIL